MIVFYYCQFKCQVNDCVSEILDCLPAKEIAAFGERHSASGCAVFERQSVQARSHRLVPKFSEESDLGQ